MPNEKYSRVYVEITTLCNRSCSFCPGTKRPKGRMSPDDFSIICDRLTGLTDYIYLHVMGEPLTHPELRRIIEIGTEKGFKCCITTNGTLLKKRADELIDSGLYKINISLHSFEDGSDEEYYTYLEDIADFAERSSDAGVLTVLRLWNEGHDEGRNIRTEDFFADRLSGEWKRGARGARIRHKLHLEYGERFDWPDKEKGEDNGGGIFCYGLADHFGILSDGRIIPCCLDREGEITLGNAFTDDIRTVLSSERAEKMREGFKKKCAAEELCKKCGYATRFK